MLLKKSTMSGIMETGGAGMSGCPCKLIFASERGVNSMYNDMMDTIGLVEKADPELAAAMDRELARQRENIELIASENIVSPAVMAATAAEPKVLAAACRITLPIAVMEYCSPIGTPMPHKDNIM